MTPDQLSDQLVSFILRDFQKDLLEEVDNNFRTEGFFGEDWQRKKIDPSQKTLNRKADSIRQSIVSHIEGTTVIIASPLPYSQIHNQGGEITVTAKMKRFFWWMYYKHSGAVKILKSGQRSKSRKNLQLSHEAELYRCLALKRVGDKIIIPQRQFVGQHPRIDASLRLIIENNTREHLTLLSEYFNNLNNNNV